MCASIGGVTFADRNPSGPRSDSVMKLTLPDCLDHGVQLAVAGHHGEAIAFYRRSLGDYPENPSILLNLANALQAAGAFAESNAIYLKLLHSTKRPMAWRIASNYLAGLQYQVDFPEAGLREVAAALGAQFGAADMAPVEAVGKLPLRIGFVGADLCDHPVGFFLLPLLRCLDRRRFVPLLFSTGGRDDTTARALKEIAEWHDVATLDTESLLMRLRGEALDILVDLSGHTAGNCLPVFARRAAPLQVSWLGYFATTGIPSMDAVLMDAWHVPRGSEDLFAESVVRLPDSRFCYQPVPFAPEVSPPPCIDNDFVTFGSFNNTAKYNSKVFTVWAQILHRVPASRLILKWRTFTEMSCRERVWEAFEAQGVARERVLLRGASSHAGALGEYADIDVALDPFPFSGGLTTCEALWMGVPVVTCPGTRPVSRQTLCFIANLRQPDWLEAWVAENIDTYCAKAVALASDRIGLCTIRTSLRDFMRCSPLMDAVGFARNFEEVLLQRIACRDPES